MKPVCPAGSNSAGARWFPWVVLVLAIFCLGNLGYRGLNEPDEGRYAGIGAAMVRSGDWLVPRLWGLPHLDKPPLTYWAVALSLSMFGMHEWAARLPQAAAALSGVGATLWLARSIRGQGVACLSAMILLSSVLYAIMGRMITTDMLLTQFVAWAHLAVWKLVEKRPREGGTAGGVERDRLGWGWVLGLAAAGGFLSKGPIILGLVAPSVIWWMFQGGIEQRRRLALGVGLAAIPFVGLAVPWFLAVFRAVPEAADFMIFRQAAGHALGAPGMHRPGPPYYYLGILAVGLLPWTVEGFRAFRRPWTAPVGDPGRIAGLWMSAWVMVVVFLLSLMRSKLPAYVLPVLPFTAILLASSLDSILGEVGRTASVVSWRILGIAAVLTIGAPVTVGVAYGSWSWSWCLAGVTVAGGTAAVGHWRSWTPLARVGAAALISGWTPVAASLWSSTYETQLRNNQSLRDLGERLESLCRPGERVVVWGRLPQGLPFYAPNAAGSPPLPYLGGMRTNRVPFELPGNVARLGSRWLGDGDERAALRPVLRGDVPLWVVSHQGSATALATNDDWMAEEVFSSGEWRILRLKKRSP